MKNHNRNIKIKKNLLFKILKEEIKKELLKEGVVNVEEYIDENTLKNIEDTFRTWIEEINESYKDENKPRDSVRYGNLEFSYLDVAKNKKNVDLQMAVMVHEEGKNIRAELKTRPRDPERVDLTVFLSPESMPLNDQQIESYINTVMNHELVHLLDAEQTKGDEKREYWKQKSEIAAFTTQIYKEVERFLKSEHPFDKLELQDIYGRMRNSNQKGIAFFDLLSIASPTFSKWNYRFNEKAGSWENNPQLKSWLTNMYKKFWPLILEKLKEV